MAEEGQTAAKGKEEEDRYDAAYLQAHARAVAGCSPHAMAGALASTDRKTHTREQARSAVKSFIKREVEV